MAKKQSTQPGFYKLIEDQLHYRQDFVLELVENQVLKLFAKLKDQYTYPSNGWFWCETAEEAVKLITGNDVELPKE